MALTTTFNTQLLVEIDALNRQFLKVLLDEARTGTMTVDTALLAHIEAGLRNSAAGIAHCPFLLYRIVDADHQDSTAGAGLLDSFNSAVADLTTLTLSFVWQLAHADLRAARLVTGASLAWCRDLAAISIAQLAGLSLRSRLHVRLIDVPGYWQDLARKRGISSLQKASLGAAGLQIMLSRSRQPRLANTIPVRAPAMHS